MEINGMNELLGKIAPGLCRLSMSGDIAVKVNGGYKSYDVDTGRLTNCDNFVFNIGDEGFFFCVPTTKVKKGDIILVNGKPKCVVEPGKNEIRVLSYEDSTIDTIVPERHMFMGNVYFYGKIVSMFGDNFKMGKKKGTEKIMQYMMLSSMFKNKDSNGSTNFNDMLPFMMLSGGNFGDMFSGMFDFEDDEDEEVETKTKEEK